MHVNVHTWPLGCLGVKTKGLSMLKGFVHYKNMCNKSLNYHIHMVESWIWFLTCQNMFKVVFTNTHKPFVARAWCDESVSKVFLLLSQVFQHIKLPKSPHIVMAFTYVNWHDVGLDIQPLWWMSNATFTRHDFPCCMKVISPTLDCIGGLEGGGLLDWIG